MASTEDQSERTQALSERLCHVRRLAGLWWCTRERLSERLCHIRRLAGSWRCTREGLSERLCRIRRTCLCRIGVVLQEVVRLSVDVAAAVAVAVGVALAVAVTMFLDVFVAGERERWPVRRISRSGHRH